MVKSIYHTYSAIEALSNRINTLADKENLFFTHIDPRVRQDGLHHNLSAIIAKLLIHSSSPARVLPTELAAFIEKYNQDNRTSLNYDAIKDSQWIQIIIGEVCFSSLLWRAFFDKESGRPFKTPEGTEIMFDCLYQFYNKTKEEEQGFSIADKELKKVFTKPEVLVLVNRKLINKKGHSRWEADFHNDYMRYLRDEIMASVWTELHQITNNHKPTKGSIFDHFISILLQFQHFPTGLKALLEQKALSEIVGFARKKLLAENGLTEVDAEFKKSWLDQPSYSGSSIEKPIPPARIINDTPLAVIRSFDDLEERYDGVFQYTSCRSSYYFLLNLIVLYDGAHGEVRDRYQQVLSILKDTTRPFLIVEIMRTIKEFNPGIFAYFLLHEDLVPLFFDTLNSMNISKDASAGIENIDISQFVNKAATETWKIGFNLFTSMIEQGYLNSTSLGATLGNIIVHQGNLCYSNRVHFVNGEIDHREYKERYEFCWQKFSELRYSSQDVSPGPRIFPSLLEDVYNILRNQSKLYQHNLILLPALALDMSVRIHTLCQSNFSKNELSAEQRDKMRHLTHLVGHSVYDLLIQFFVSDKVTKLDYATAEAVLVEGSRLTGDFAFEIMDWAYLFGVLQGTGRYQELHSHFIGNVRLQTDESRDSYKHNSREIEKIRAYVKSQAIALTQLSETRQHYRSKKIETERLTEMTSEVITDLTLEYAKERLGYIDLNLLRTEYRIGSDILYHEELPDILFKAINHLSIERQMDFYKRYFRGSDDIGMLLKAINTTEQVEVKKMLSRKVKKLKITQYIKNYTVIELRMATIEAINSEEFYHLSEPLLDEVAAFSKRHPYAGNDDAFIYEIRLLLAYKRNDRESINAVNIPIRPHYSPEESQALLLKKQRYIGLYTLHYEKDIVGALDIFKALVLKNPDDFDYQYRLFYANIVLAKNDHDDLRAAEAIRVWDVFALKHEKESPFAPRYLEDSVTYTKALAATVLNDLNLFERCFSRLPKSYKFDDQLIGSVYKFYMDHELPHLASLYITDCGGFYRNLGMDEPEALKVVLKTFDTDKQIKRLAESFREIISLSPAKLIQTVPEKFNGKLSLEEFILMELLLTVNTLLEKVKALDSIKMENKYNDIILAIMRLRIAIWGLEMTDQPRTGSSTTGKDLGELDFVIRDGSGIVAVLEALVIRSLEKSKITEHILKCEYYSATALHYYVINYYVGPKENFDNLWQGYKPHVDSITYPSGFQLTKKMEDVTGFSVLRNIKAGICRHGEITVYHILCNISAVAVTHAVEKPKKATKKQAATTVTNVAKRTKTKTTNTTSIKKGTKASSIPAKKTTTKTTRKPASVTKKPSTTKKPKGKKT